MVPTTITGGKKRMLTMHDIHTIKNLRNNHDKSINHIAKELNVNWRTVKKYADGDLIPVVKSHKKTGLMYTGGWAGLSLYGSRKIQNFQKRSGETPNSSQMT